MTKTQGMSQSQSPHAVNGQDERQRERAAEPAPRQGGTDAREDGDAQQPVSLEQVQQQAGTMLTSVREQATGQIVSQKEQIASTLSVLAGALHDAGQQVRDQDAGPVAGYVDAAANQVDQLATILQDQDLPQLVETVKRFSQRQPGLFLAATLALGFVGVRFLKSGSGANGAHAGARNGSLSQRHNEDSTRGQDWSTRFADTSSTERMVDRGWSADYQGAVGSEPR